MNPYDTPSAEVRENDSLSAKPSPPGLVKLSIAGIALTIIPGIAKMFYLAMERGTFRMDNPGGAIGFLIGIGLLTGVVLLVLRGLYRGSKLVYWFLIGYALLSILSFRYPSLQFSHYKNSWEKGLFLYQGIGQGSSAVLLLFPSSWRWFHKKTASA
jgi:hypothetical protein